MAKQDVSKLSKLSTDEIFMQLAKIIQEQPELQNQIENLLHSKFKATLETMAKSTLNALLETSAKQLPNTLTLMK
jgi:hypothetical protein